MYGAGPERVRGHPGVPVVPGSRRPRGQSRLVSGKNSHSKPVPLSLETRHTLKGSVPIRSRRHEGRPPFPDTSPTPVRYWFRSLSLPLRFSVPGHTYTASRRVRTTPPRDTSGEVGRALPHHSGSSPGHPSHDKIGVVKDTLTPVVRTEETRSQKGPHFPPILSRTEYRPTP